MSLAVDRNTIFLSNISSTTRRDIPEMSDQKDTIRDQSGSAKPTLPRGKRSGFGEAGVALTYEGADAVFNVSSYRGALLLQAGARKADGGFATTKRVVRRADEGA